MKKLLKKLRDLDDDELAALQEAIHGELQSRHPEPGFVANKLRLRVVEEDDIADDDDDEKAPRRCTA